MSTVAWGGLYFLRPNIANITRFIMSLT